MWLWNRPADEPDIPPPPDVEDTSDEVRRLSELVKHRAMRGRRLTRATQQAIAQNHFAANIRKAMEV